MSPKLIKITAKDTEDGYKTQRLYALPNTYKLQDEDFGFEYLELTLEYVSFAEIKLSSIPVTPLGEKLSTKPDKVKTVHYNRRDVSLPNFIKNSVEEFVQEWIKENEENKLKGSVFWNIERL